MSDVISGEWDAAVKEYEREGYVVLRNVLDPGEVMRSPFAGCSWRAVAAASTEYVGNVSCSTTLRETAEGVLVGFDTLLCCPSFLSTHILSRADVTTFNPS